MNEIERCTNPDCEWIGVPKHFHPEEDVDTDDIYYLLLNEPKAKNAGR